MALLKLIGKAFLFLAACAILTASGLFVVGAYLTTWPLMRKSPRNRRLLALMQLGETVTALARAFAPEPIITQEDSTNGEVTPKSA